MLKLLIFAILFSLAFGCIQPEGWGCFTDSDCCWVCPGVSCVMLRENGGLCSPWMCYPREHSCTSDCDCCSNNCLINELDPGNSKRMSEHSTLNKDVSEESSENSQPVSTRLRIKQQFGSDSYSPDSSDKTFGNLNFSKSSNSSHNSIEMITGYNGNLDESESVSFDQRKNNTSKRSYSDTSTFSDSENTSSCIHYSESEDEKTELKITYEMQKKFIDFLVSFKGSTEDYFKNKLTKNMKKYFFDFSYVLEKVTNCGKFNRQIFDINNQLFKSIVHFVIGENNKQNEKEDLIYYLYHNIYLEIEEGKEFLLKNHQGGLYGVCNFCGSNLIPNCYQKIEQPNDLLQVWCSKCLKLFKNEETQLNIPAFAYFCPNLPKKFFFPKKEDRRIENNLSTGLSYSQYYYI
ncbi:hypothetical protein M0812_16656 [Anaeramoeba flamelloides]|uniref:Uncharacterized protein n=1 Tax=Anaeramoeba flamelloides TaxID=1746091 RepID=A0AAV7ZBC5_9EUKA|nr:hypothetical protein M0812_16656 [Anaeramoeba flamelloides]